MKAKKSLGQHFLKSPTALAKIVDAGDIHADDIVLEIGPGMGILTEKMILRANKVIAVEKDRELVGFLKEKFSDAIQKTRLDIVEKDILQFDPGLLRFYHKPYKLIANIPYYITGAILEKFLSAEYQPERMVLLLQKEVADRIVARNKRETILSISVKVFGKATVVAKVPAGAFNPPPKVDSALLVIDEISRDFFDDVDEKKFFELVRFLFGKKRGQIGGSLAKFLGNKARAHACLETVGFDPRLRPENLSVAQWRVLTKTIQEC
ncbi:MAG TPA: 16S rRNA (adenine(1518)-N(6)/adenine(1519)-N(6))-dimethyltransferase RsmA [Candidatus Paceibacterota bacterium]|nr:16S rRNA (adenine(1518)-N(6)/adenine(1519)-N(6))-dimethyltransferase RsmA [Candidatus Paceibacterota bacterium]